MEKLKIPKRAINSCDDNLVKEEIIEEISRRSRESKALIVAMPVMNVKICITDDTIPR